MKRTLLISIFIISLPTHAEGTDYLTGFKVPVQQTFCISRSLNGDIEAYKQCMLAIERESHKCDESTKPLYEVFMAKYGNYDRGLTEFMDEIEPITKSHFDCLSEIY